MRSTKIVFYGALAALLAGCGGGGGISGTGTGGRVSGELSGIVTDANNNPVRGAKVYVDGSHSTLSNSNGSYVLQSVTANTPVIVRASISQDNATYTGANLADLFDRDRSKNVNIVVVREDQHARLTGFVTDRNGSPVEGARVFVNGGHLSSSFATTISDGSYAIDTLMTGLDYSVLASARGFDSDSDIVNLTRDGRSLDLVLSNASNSSLPAPANLQATAWTSPNEVTRSTDRAAYEAIKRMIDPRRADSVARGRDSVDGNPIEFELVWDPVQSSALLGYGVYRGSGTNGAQTPIDYLRDPLASVYEDADATFREGQTYNFSLTSLNTVYPDSRDSESAPSNVAVAVTLSDLRLLAPVGNPPVFRWETDSGATSYTVYVFDTYPGIGVTSIWNNAASQSTGASATYSGPSLLRGNRYFYVVSGQANGGASRNISRIESFVAP